MPAVVNSPMGMILDDRSGDPPDLRPMVQLDEWTVRDLDLNDLYRRDQPQQPLKRRLDLGAPGIIINNEADARRPSARCSTTPPQRPPVRSPTARSRALRHVEGRSRAGSVRTCSASV
jgi:hypothetical protein